VNAVWIDHDAFDDQEAKSCATNLYVLAMLRYAFLPMLALFEPQETLRDAFRKAVKSADPHPLPRWFGVQGAQSLEYEKYEGWCDRILAAVVERHWDPSADLFVVHKDIRGPDRHSDDRSLATAVIFGFCPKGHVESCVNALATRPKWMGQSYPANMVWNYWALAQAGRIQAVIDDLRERWAPMRSVVEANALQEVWTTAPDSTNLMSHCPVAPLTALYQGIMGLWPTQPGFTQMALRPQLGEIESLYLVAHTPQGPVKMIANPFEVIITVPAPAIVYLLTGERHVRPGQTIEIPRDQCG
jgi:hypothetical protein